MSEIYNIYFKQGDRSILKNMTSNNHNIWKYNNTYFGGSTRAYDSVEVYCNASEVLDNIIYKPFAISIARNDNFIYTYNFTGQELSDEKTNNLDIFPKLCPQITHRIESLNATLILSIRDLYRWPKHPAKHPDW